MEICIKWSMCRTCTGGTSSQLQPLFKDSILAEQLLEYAGVLVKPDDGLPDQICVECVQHLQFVHTFLTGCKRVDVHLRGAVRRTMSLRKCFPSVPAVDANTENCDMESEIETQARKQSSQSNPNQSKKILNTHPGKNATEQEELVPEDIVIQEVESSEELDLLTTTTTQSSEKSSSATGADDSDDYVLVVSKCMLNLTQSEAVENNDSEYNAMDVGDPSGREDDHEHDDNDEDKNIEQDSNQVADADNEPATNDNEMEPAAAVAPLTIDLSAALELSNSVKHNCSMCGNSFGNQAQLKSHMRTHRNERSYECELCSKRFNAACNLTTHMRTHTGEKPYECTHCGRRFADRSTQRNHERSHTNERPYACETCGKTFSLSSTLKAHSLSHSKLKPHKCLTCNKDFRLPHHLKAHERTHVHRCEVDILIYNRDDGDYTSS
ncbi:zinc finger protein 771 [Drosophila grimshawi]|uniref:GH19509 n=1 Tax=Drosophila grimshawi TaxID=7222 RepID=B4JGY7_DROGR|nr:zinc finger protein 771 [Drosophila grimshawi]EDV93765.1 GH19509 [Drosophila grimshawi]